MHRQELLVQCHEQHARVRVANQTLMCALLLHILHCFSPVNVVSIEVLQRRHNFVVGMLTIAFQEKWVRIKQLVDTDLSFPLSA